MEPPDAVQLGLGHYSCPNCLQKIPYSYVPGEWKYAAREAEDTHKRKCRGWHGEG